MRSGAGPAKTEMKGVGAEAQATAAQVSKIGTAATAAAAQTAAAMKLIHGAMKDPTSGRFVSPTTFQNPAFQAAEDKQNAAIAANVLAKNKATVATNEAAVANKGLAAAEVQATTATTGLNAALSTTRMLLGAFTILAFIGFMVGATQAASEFQSEMLLLRTQARSFDDEFGQMTKSVMALAPAVRTGPEELAKGLYHIESVGLRGARALEVLTAAALGARVGNADLEAVTNALVASVTSGIDGVTTMSKAMGVLDGIVGSGNMRMEELSKSLSSGVLATAKAFGLAIQDVGAALAAMTDQGIPAQEAATRLRITITLLGSPTEKAAQQLSRIGLTSRDLADKMRSPDGLIGALVMLRDHLQRSGMDATEQAQLLKTAFGGSRSSSGLLTLIGSVDLLNLKMNTIKAAEQDFTKVAALQAETTAAHIQRLGAVVDVLKISIGNALNPVLEVMANVLGFVAEQTGILVPLLTALLAILIALATKVIVAFVVNMVQLGATMILNASATLGLNAAFILMALTEVSTTLATEGLGAAMMELYVIFGVFVLPVAAVGIALALLILNFDRVAQGTRVLAFYFWQGVAALLDAASQLPFVGDSFKGVAQAAHESAAAIAREMGNAETAINQKAAGMDGALSDLDPTKALVDKLEAGTGDIVDETKTLVELFGTSLEGVRKAAGAAGGAAMADMAAEIRKHQQEPLDALYELHDMLKNALDPAVERARLYGELYSVELALGMASQDPAVRAQAEATKKLIEERLDELSDGAYSAGVAAADSLSRGFNAQMIDNAAHMAANGKELYGPFLVDSVTAKAKADALVPSVDAIADAMKGVNAEMNKAEIAEGITKLKQAFSEISTAAHAYFDKVHQDTLRAIDDARDHKNAILDAKKALNQAPVTAAQKALDFQRDQIQEFRLREAIAKANGPEAYRDAVLALQDFLAQQHIDQMQDQVDAANDRIDNQKTANDRAAEAAKAAENARYETQKANFDRELELLRQYLEKHPGEWSRANARVLELLSNYGITYKKAGAALGQSFADGLREQVGLAIAAIRMMMTNSMTDIGTQLGLMMANFFNTVTGANTGGWPANGMGVNYIGPRATGDWNILKDNSLALLHQGEMVVPADASNLLRQLGSRRMGMSEALSGASGGSTGGNTYQVFVGDEKIVEIFDHGLRQNADIYGPARVTTGARR